MTIEDVLGCTAQPLPDALRTRLQDRTTRSGGMIAACLIVTVGACLALSGCGSSSGSQTSQELATPDGLQESADSAPPLATLGDGEPLLSPVPDFVSTETRADTGIQIAYTSEAQLILVDPGFVEGQWQFMLTCLELVAPPPVIIIIDGSITPFTPADDVLYSFDGKINASASASGASVVIQIRVSDFDGSLGNPGFNLRSIMGRSLWLSAGMAERDYPFVCARTPAEST